MIAQLFAIGVSTFVCGQFAVSERLRLALVLVAPLLACSLSRIMAAALREFLVKVGQGREEK